MDPLVRALAALRPGAAPEGAGLGERLSGGESPALERARQLVSSGLHREYFDAAEHAEDGGARDFLTRGVASRAVLLRKSELLQLTAQVRLCLRATECCGSARKSPPSAPAGLYGAGRAPQAERR